MRVYHFLRQFQTVRARIADRQVLNIFERKKIWQRGARAVAKADAAENDAVAGGHGAVETEH
jgi:hypothetical protein